MMDPITVGTVVRSFAGLIMNQSFSRRKKQILVIALSIIFFLGDQVANGVYTYPELYTSLLEGCTAGLSAIGMYELTKNVDNGSSQNNI